MNKPLALSLIIPAYNEHQHLQACLDTVAAQTVMPFEVIVVDNNSTDDTVNIAKSYPFVRVIKERKQGIVYARDAGFNAAKGNIIGRIDADTHLPNDWVEKVTDFYAKHENANSALTGGGFFYNVRMRRFNGWLLGQLAYRANRFVSGHYILWGSNMAFPTAMWKQVKSKVCLRQDIHEDMDLAIHVHELGYPIVYQETLRVGVYLKRVWQGRDKLHEHMQRWPKTLKVHQYKHWWVGTVGNLFLWYIAQPLIYLAEGIARLEGKRSIQ